MANHELGSAADSLQEGDTEFCGLYEPGQTNVQIGIIPPVYLMAKLKEYIRVTSARVIVANAEAAIARLDGNIGSRDMAATSEDEDFRL